MSAKRSFRLVRPDALAIETAPEKECRHAHDLAIETLTFRRGCRCGESCVGAGGCAGTIFRRLRPVPAGFQEVPL